MYIDGGGLDVSCAGVILMKRLALLRRVPGGLRLLGQSSRLSG